MSLYTRTLSSESSRWESRCTENGMMYTGLSWSCRYPDLMTRRPRRSTSPKLQLTLFRTQGQALWLQITHVRVEISSCFWDVMKFYFWWKLVLLRPGKTLLAALYDYWHVGCFCRKTVKIGVSIKHNWYFPNQNLEFLPVTINDRYPQSLSFLTSEWTGQLCPKILEIVVFLPLLSWMTDILTKHTKEWQCRFLARRIVVLGDTHGQLGDVLWAMSEFGMPNEKNIYVVNGDIAPCKNKVDEPSEQVRGQVVILALSFCEDVACLNELVWACSSFSPFFSILSRSLKFCASRAARQTGAIGLPRFLSSSWRSCCSIPMIQ